SRSGRASRAGRAGPWRSPGPGPARPGGQSVNRASFIRGDRDREAIELLGELDLAAQARARRVVVAQLGQQVLLVALLRRKPVYPVRAHVDMACGARTQATADRHDAVVEFPQRLHHFEAALAVDLVADAI